MKRRQFLRRIVVGTSSAGILAPLAGAREIALAATAHRRYRRLGPPCGPDARSELIEALALDTFIRLCAIPGAARVALVDWPGPPASPMTPMTQWNVGIFVPRWRDDPPLWLDLDGFRYATSHWTKGAHLWIDSTKRPVETPASVPSIWRAATTTALAPLPAGVSWGSHYVDAQTGRAMRVIYNYEIAEDRWILRFDVLVG